MYSTNTEPKTQHFRVYSNISRDWIHQLIDHYPSINLSFLFLSSLMTGFWSIFHGFFCRLLKTFFFNLIFTLIVNYFGIFLQLFTLSFWRTGMSTFPWKSVGALCSSVSSKKGWIGWSDSKNEIVSCLEEPMKIFLLALDHFHFEFRVEEGFSLFDLCELNLFIFILFMIFPYHRDFFHVDSMQELFLFLFLFFFVYDLFLILN